MARKKKSTTNKVSDTIASEDVQNGFLEESMRNSSTPSDGLATGEAASENGHNDVAAISVSSVYPL